MKIVESILSLLSTIFLCMLTIKKDVKYAVALLIRSSISLAVTIYELVTMNKIERI